MTCGKPKFLFVRCDEDSDQSYTNGNRTSLGSVSSDILTSSESPPTSATSSLSSEGYQERDMSAYLKRFSERVNSEKKSYTREISNYSDDDKDSTSFRSSTPKKEVSCRYCQSYQTERQYFLWRSQYTRSSFCTRCSKDSREKAYISYWGKPSYENGSWRKRLKEGRNVDIDLTPLIEVLHRIDRMDTSMGKTTYYSNTDRFTHTPTYKSSTPKYEESTPVNKKSASIYENSASTYEKSCSTNRNSSLTCDNSTTREHSTKTCKSSSQIYKNSGTTNEGLCQTWNENSYNKNINNTTDLHPNEDVQPSTEGQHSLQEQRRQSKSNKLIKSAQNCNTASTHSKISHYNNGTGCIGHTDTNIDTVLDNKEMANISFKELSNEQSSIFLSDASESNEYISLKEEMASLNNVEIENHSNNNFRTNGNRIESRLLDSIVNATDEEEYISDESLSNVSDESSSIISFVGDNTSMNESIDETIFVKKSKEHTCHKPLVKSINTGAQNSTMRLDTCKPNDNVETEVDSVKNIISMMESITTINDSKNESQVHKPKQKQYVSNPTSKSKTNKRLENDSLPLLDKTSIKDSESDTKLNMKHQNLHNDCKRSSVRTVTHELNKNTISVTETSSNETKHSTGVKEQLTRQGECQQPEIPVNMEGVKEPEKTLSTVTPYVHEQNMLMTNHLTLSEKMSGDKYQSFTPKRVSTANDTDNKSAKSGSRVESSIGRYQQKRRFSRSQRDRRSSLIQLRTAQDDEDDEFMQIQQKINTLGKYSTKKKPVQDDSDNNTINIPKSIWNHTIRKAIYGTPTYFVIDSEEDLSDTCSSSESNEGELSVLESDDTDKEKASEEERINSLNMPQIHDNNIPQIKTDTIQHCKQELKSRVINSSVETSSTITNESKNACKNLRKDIGSYTDALSSAPVETSSKRKQSIDLQEIRSRRLQVAKSLKSPTIIVSQVAEDAEDHCVDLDNNDKEVTKLNWRSRGYKYDFFLSRQSRTGTEIIEQYKQARSNKSSKANTPISSAESSRRSSLNKRARNLNIKSLDQLTVNGNTYSGKTINSFSSQNRLEAENSCSRPESRRSSDHSKDARAGISVHKLKAALERAAECSERLEQRLEQQLK